MFRKSRLKIVTVMMSVLLLLFIGTVCVIYFSSYAQMFARNQEMLLRYAHAYWENGNPAETNELPPNPTTDDISGERVYRPSSFYSVLFSETGEIFDINNAASIGVSDN